MEAQHAIDVQSIERVIKQHSIGDPHAAWAVQTQETVWSMNTGGPFRPEFFIRDERLARSKDKKNSR